MTSGMVGAEAAPTVPLSAGGGPGTQCGGRRGRDRQQDGERRERPPGSPSHGCGYGEHPGRSAAGYGECRGFDGQRGDGVDDPGADRLVAPGSRAAGRPGDAVHDLAGGQARTALADQRSKAGDERGGEAGAVQRRPGAPVHAQRPHARPGGGHVDPRPPDGEPRGPVVRADRAHGEHVVLPSGQRHQVRAVRGAPAAVDVAGRRHDHDVRGGRRPERGAQRCALDGGLLDGQAHRTGDVDDRGSGADRLPQRCRQRAQVTRGPPVRSGDRRAELAQREDPGPGSDPGRAVPRVRSSSDQPGHGGAVAVAVVEPVTPREQVVQPDQPAGEPGMRGHPGVDHRDALTAPGRQRVHSGQTQPLGQRGLDGPGHRRRRGAADGWRSGRRERGEQRQHRDDRHTRTHSPRTSANTPAAARASGTTAAARTPLDQFHGPAGHGRAGGRRTAPSRS